MSSYFGQKLHINNKHLYWENDTPFFLLADTFWYGLTKRVSLHDFETVLKKRKAQGFTAIQLVVGPPPEISIFDDNAKSTNGEFPFNQDHTVNLAYFADIQPKLELVVKHKLVPILYGSWGNYIDSVGEQAMKDLWTEIIKISKVYPVMYSLTGEVDIFPAIQKLKQSPLLKLIPTIWPLRKIYSAAKKLLNHFKLKGRIRKWQQVADHLKEINTSGNPLMVHCHHAGLASELFTDTSWIDIDTFQSGHSPEQGIENMRRNFRKAKSGSKPVINLEPLYEGIMEQTDITLQKQAFWYSVLNGAAGHCYGAHGIWQFADHDNFMQHWGKSDWKTALELPGASALGNVAQWIKDTFGNNWTQTELIISTHTTIAGKIGKHAVVYTTDMNDSNQIEIPGYILDHKATNQPDILVFKQV